MQRRLPKRGFQNINRVDYVPLNLGHLEDLVKKTGLKALDVEALVAAGIGLASGTITSQVNIKVHAISASAKAAIEAAGGSVELV